MTLRARLFQLFPFAWLVAVGAIAAAAVAWPGIGIVLLLVAVVYLLPVACHRIHEMLWPVREGRSRLDTPDYSPWWGAHQFQLVYLAFPALEAALRLVPGAYSAWLRLWGSRIGRNVHWTPRVDIVDRNLLDVGDGVIFGDRVACYGHVVKRRGDALVLYVRRVRIGAGVLLGAGSRLGPGVRVDDGARVESRTDLEVGRRVRAGTA